MKKCTFSLLALTVSGVLYSSAMAQREGGDRPAPRDGAQREAGPRDGEGPGRGQRPEGGPGRRPEGGEGGRGEGGRGPGGEGGRGFGGPGGEGGRGFGGPGGEGGRGFGPPPNPIMVAIDKDGDHVLSAEEIEGAVAALKTLDKNKDGKLTQDELRPDFGGRPGDGPLGGGRPGDGPPGGGRPGDGPPGGGRGPGGEGGDRASTNEVIDRLMGYDKNKDGKLSGDELPDRLRDMLTRGDTNKDNGLDRAELEKMIAQVRGANSRGGDGGPPREGGRPPGEGRRPPGDGDRPEGDRPPRDGDRPEGDRPPRDGDRPEGDRPRRPAAE